MQLFDFSCPHCGTIFKAKDSWNGLSIKCPGCKRSVKIAAGNTGRFKQDTGSLLKNRGKNLLLFFALLTAAVLISAGIIYRWHTVGRKHIEKTRRAEEKRALQPAHQAEAKRLQIEKHLTVEKALPPEKRLTQEKAVPAAKPGAEEKRVLTEKQNAEKAKQLETVFIKQEIARAVQCTAPEETVKKLDKLLRTFPLRQDLHPEIRSKRKLYGEKIHIDREILRAENSGVYSEKISLLENVIKRYPVNPFNEKARTLLSAYRAEDQAIREKIAACDQTEKKSGARKIQDENPMQSEIQSEALSENRSQSAKRFLSPAPQRTKAENLSSEDICRWCRGSGKRVRFSSIRDCTFCLGHGTRMSYTERQHHKPSCRTFRKSQIGCSGAISSSEYDTFVANSRLSTRYRSRNFQRFYKKKNIRRSSCCTAK